MAFVHLSGPEPELREVRGLELPCTLLLGTSSARPAHRTHRRAVSPQPRLATWLTGQLSQGGMVQGPRSSFLFVQPIALQSQTRAGLSFLEAGKRKCVESQWGGGKDLALA